MVAETSKAARATVPSLTEQIVKCPWAQSIRVVKPRPRAAAESETTSAVEYLHSLAIALVAFSDTVHVHIN